MVNLKNFNLKICTKDNVLIPKIEASMIFLINQNTHQIMTNICKATINIFKIQIKPKTYKVIIIYSMCNIQDPC